MKWEIEDEWIELWKLAKNHWHFSYFREWNKKYWFKNVSGESRVQAKDRFNKESNNKTFRNCELYHGILYQDVLLKKKDAEKIVVLSRSDLRCEDCTKKIKRIETVNCLFKDDPLYFDWGYSPRWYCKKCLRIKRQIEKLRE